VQAQFAQDDPFIKFYDLKDLVAFINPGLYLVGVAGSGHLQIAGRPYYT
jgi:hypothetical protein